jgi:hypothetical protein
MSAPAANARSEPVSSRQPISGSRSNSSAAATTSVISRVLRALSASGRFNVIRPTRPRRSASIVSYCVMKCAP